MESARRCIAEADKVAAPAPVLTQPMLEALVWAQQNDGYVVAGHSVSDEGSRYTFAAGSIRGLAARGLAELKPSPEGDLSGTLTEAGRAYDVLAGPVGDRLVSVDGGEPISLREFAKLNEGIDLLRYIRLGVDDVIREGGGAAARFKVKRTAAPEGWKRFSVTKAVQRVSGDVVATNGRYEVWAHRFRIGNEGQRRYAVGFDAIEILDPTPGKRKVRDIQLPTRIRSNLDRIIAFLSERATDA